MQSYFFSLITLAAMTSVAFAHSWKAGAASNYDEALRAHILGEWQQRQHVEKQNATPQFAAKTGFQSAGKAPAQAAPFVAFAPKVTVKWDDIFLYIESNGIPAHNMMVGITAWQQQVPLPQNYTGDNAWRIPLKPIAAKQPVMIKGRFLRGAIALAVNGIPIFNPQNNRGEVSLEIGELDQWGGHCGRADDYHYHITPLHLQSAVGKGQPVAYALDGYPIYGLTEPDGSALGSLDECHGHEAAGLGYHYHAATKYPYVIAGFHGKVAEAEGQVDPQPRAQPVREALQALRGAEITSFETTGANSYKLSYQVGNDKRSVAFAYNADGTYPFEFDNGREGVSKEVYAVRQGGGGKGGPRDQGGPGGPQGKVKGGKGRSPEGNPPPSNADEPPVPREGVKRGEVGGAHGSKKKEFVESPDQPRTSNGNFLLSSSEVEDLKEMPTDYTGEGSGATLPLDWKGAPIGTKEYALIMDHTDPEGVKKWYWTVYEIPTSVTSFPKNVQGIGKVGTGFKGQIGYEPPHSKGPGAKTYVLTMYALSAPLNLTQSPCEVNREVLLAAMKDKVLASSSLRVVHTSSSNSEAAGAGNQRPRPQTARNEVTPPREETKSKSEAPLSEASGGQRKPWIRMHGEELDADKDRFVTAIEIASDMKKAFAIYDSNKDGIITPQEIETAGDIREGAAFAGFIYRHAIDLDADNDSRLTAEEALGAAKYIFSSADQDHDGKITISEITSAPNAPFPIPPNPGNSTMASAHPTKGLRSLDNIFSNNSPTESKNEKPSNPTRPGGESVGRGEKGKGTGKRGADNKDLIKPAMSDTIKVNVYADNWFMLYINGKLTAVDSIDFIPHNVVTVDILPEYPMTIAVMAKDNADAKTGMEYGDHIGDGGFIIKFGDGTASNASWKAKAFFKGPLNHDAANPKVNYTAIPENWFAVDFDDRQWANAIEYTEERVNPKAPYFEADFAGAKFIWSEDLDLDNTILFRTKIEKPSWTKRWNTKPDLDVSGAPAK